MRNKARQLTQRRLALTRRCEMQRDALLYHGKELRHMMSAIDHTVRVLHQVRQHPALLLSAMTVVLMVVRPRRFAAALKSVTTAMRTWSLVAPVVRTLRTRS